MTHMHKFIISAIAAISLSSFAQSSGTYMGTGTASGSGSGTSTSTSTSSSAGSTADPTSFTRNPATIRQVQQALIDHGHDVGRVDGVWGTRTSQALQSFQSDQGITSSSNGVLDSQTMSALGVTPSASAPTGNTQRSPATDMPSDTSTRQGRSPGNSDMNDDTSSGSSTTDRGSNPGQR